MRLDDRKVVELPLDDILPNRFQPRITFNEDAINELAESIKEHGVIQPIVVRKINDKYEIIAGERRYKASTMAGKSTIPAIVTDLNDKESAEIALIENVQREDLTAIEEAVSYKKILDMGYLTQEELSGKLGKKQSTISNKLRLLNLDEEVQEALLEKKISERHARSLLKLNSKDQKKLLNRIIEERLTVRRTDEEIEKILHPEKQIEKEQKDDVIETLEILDLDDNSKEGETNTMNNEFNNNFAIPTQPIMNDAIPVTPMVEESVKETNYNIPVSQIIEDVKPVEPSFNNPGFMDVNKIVETATDINVEKPVANMEDLLQPTQVTAPVEETVPSVDASIFGFNPTSNTSEQSTKVVEPVEQQADVLQPGKFFNLTADGELHEPATEAPVEETTPESISAMLNNSVINEAPVAEEMKPVEENTNSNTSSMFGINLEPKNPDYVGNVDAKEANLDFGIPSPTVNNDNLNFDSFFQTEAPKESTTSTPVVESQPTVSVVPEVVEEIKPVEPVSSVMPDFTEVNTVMPNGEQSQQPTNYNVPTAEELDAFLSNLDSTTPLTTMPEATPVESVINVAPQSNGVDVQSKMEQVKAIMKEAKQKVEALGIKIELDEFDFEDMYQAIFKIDK